MRRYPNLAWTSLTLFRFRAFPVCLALVRTFKDLGVSWCTERSVFVALESALAKMALAAYRNLLRATRVAFQGDHQMLVAARSQARAGFDKSRSLEPSSDAAQKEVAHAEGVAEILRRNLVQGKQVDGKKNAYQLRIHEDTERGDNDTIRNPRVPGGKVKIGGI
ncbi:hypothetical protein R6Q59_010103 [Mikania micrantha]